MNDDMDDVRARNQTVTKMGLHIVLHVVANHASCNTGKCRKVPSHMELSKQRLDVDTGTGILSLMYFFYCIENI